MLRTLEQFRGALKGIVRPNRFQANIDFPASVPNRTELNNLAGWLAQSTSLPKSTVGVIEVPYKGAKLKIAGDRTYDSWDVVFIVDRSFKLRSAFEAWMEITNSVIAGTASNDFAYKTNQEVIQEDGAQNPIKNYILVGAFVSDVADIPLAQDSNDQFETFSVTFNYDYHLTSIGVI
jgi:hypothetical protein